jgi:hypothetical protein
LGVVGGGWGWLVFGGATTAGRRQARPTAADSQPPRRIGRCGLGCLRCGLLLHCGAANIRPRLFTASHCKHNLQTVAIKSVHIFAGQQHSRNYCSSHAAGMETGKNKEIWRVHKYVRFFVICVLTNRNGNLENWLFVFPQITHYAKNRTCELHNTIHNAQSGVVLQCPIVHRNGQHNVIWTDAQTNYPWQLLAVGGGCWAAPLRRAGVGRLSAWSIVCPY